MYDHKEFELMLQLLNFISLLLHHMNQKLNYHSEKQLMKEHNLDNQLEF